jgi:ribose transport system substrate-binding protein
VSQATTALDAYYKGVFTAPPTSAPPHKAGVKLWIISCGQASEGCANPAAAAASAATSLGWSVKVFDGNFGVGDAYDTGIRQAIAAGAQVIITEGINCNQAKAGYQAAHNAGVIVVGANSADCSDPLVKDGPNLMSATVKYQPTFPTGGDARVLSGKAKADWIIVHTHGQAKVINMVFQGLTDGEYENQGFTSELAKCGTCKIVDTIKFSPADTANGTLKQEFATALAQYPDANAGVILDDAIVIQNDMPQALQTAGRTKTFALVAGSGFAQNLNLIRNNSGQAADISISTSWTLWGAVDEAIRLLDKKPAVFEGSGVQAVDATHNLPPAGQNWAPPVDYPALYKKAWGVS